MTVSSGTDTEIWFSTGRYIQHISAIQKKFSTNGVGISTERGGCSPKSVRDDNLLDLVKRLRDTLDTLDALEGGRATVPLVGDHTTDSAQEHVCHTVTVRVLLGCSVKGTPSVVLVMVPDPLL